MGKEQGCENPDGEDLEISRTIPVIPEDFCDIVHGDNPADSGVSLPSRTIEEKADQVWPPVVYAPLGDPAFWLEFHIGHVAYALRQAEKIQADALLAEARNEILEASVEREWWEKVRLGNQLEKQEDAHKEEMRKELSNRANVIAKYIHLIYLRHLMADRYETKIEEKETLIRMYEERFGSVEELLKLSQAEENSKLAGPLGPRKYVNISTLIKQHETGRKPLMHRVSDVLEKMLSPTTYGNIASAVYAAFRGKEPDNSCG